MSAKSPTFALGFLAAGLLALAALWGGYAPAPATTPVRVMADAPPGVRFISVALGGLRGLFADILWVRAADLQSEGRFFEVAQLSEWITKLEPRYAEVWAYHAWNMAYNITAVVPDPADRWHWIKNGMRLLRDEGIPANPANPRLYWELGWLFHDKAGGRWDDATPFYRIAWAGEITRLLGGGFADYALIDRDEKASRALAMVGLKVDVMKALDQDYGPLDWRLPETHAIYWGYRGKAFASRDALWCERLVWMGLTETVKGGALLFRPERQCYQRGPRLDLAVKAIHHCEGIAPDGDPLVILAISAFLREAAFHMDVFQSPAGAESALRQLKRFQPSGIPASTTLESFIHGEVVARLKGLDAPDREVLVMTCLVQGAVWRRLGSQVFADGYERLARLYWLAAAGADDTDQEWQVLRQKAGEQAANVANP